MRLLNKRQKFMFYFFNWIRAWLEIFCAIVSICTFALYRPWFDFSWFMWASKYQIERRMLQNGGRRGANGYY